LEIKKQKEEDVMQNDKVVKQDTTELQKEKPVYTKENPCPTCGWYKKTGGGGPRGPKNTKPVDQMTDEELSREIINASSVLYKAKQRNADAETIKANDERVTRAKAEKEKRKAKEAPKEEKPKDDAKK